MHGISFADIIQSYYRQRKMTAVCDSKTWISVPKVIRHTIDTLPQNTREDTRTLSTSSGKCKYFMSKNYNDDDDDGDDNKWVFNFWLKEAKVTRFEGVGPWPPRYSLNTDLSGIFSDLNIEL